jgi:site-specific recombinase XerD
MTKKIHLHLSPTRLESEIKLFLGDYLKDRSVETKGTYERALNEFKRYFLKAHPWFRFRTDDIEKYKTYLTDEKGLHEVSVSTYLTAIRRLIQYFVTKGLMSENTAKSVKGNKRPESHTADTLTEAEADKLLNTIQAERLVDLRDLVIVRLMLDAAASEHELIKADVGDLKKIGNAAVLYIQAKGHKTKDETLEIPPALFALIEKYLRKRENVRNTSPLIVSHGNRASDARMTTRAIRYRINFWLAEAGLKADAKRNISPHSLRHTAAKLWLERDGLPLDEVKRRMRHGLITTTKIYTGGK